MKIVFFGTSDYCLPVLEALHQSFDLQLVITRPDKPIGRKYVLTPSATKTWATEHKIPAATPETLKKDTQDRQSLTSLISKISPDLAIVSDYGLMIPEAIFNLPKLGTFNIHFSKLPDLRGPSPIQFTLLHGNTKAWITLFKLENPPALQIKMDSGPIYWQKSYPIYPNDTTQTLYTRLFQEIAKDLPSLILRIPQITPIPQDHSKATFTRFLTKEDGFVKWEDLKNATRNPKPQTSTQIYNQYRATFPWPGLWTIVPIDSKGPHKDKRLIIRKCHLEDEKLILDEIQFEGMTPVAYPQED